MSKEDLHKSLEGLRAEIDTLGGGDSQAKERMTRLIGDLEHQLENPDDAAHQARLRENLSRTIEQFEVEHPRATGILNHIMVTLGNMGI